MVKRSVASLTSVFGCGEKLVCVCVCVHVCACMCVRACVCVHVLSGQDIHVHSLGNQLTTAGSPPTNSS